MDKIKTGKKIFIAIPTIGHIDSFVAHSLFELIADTTRLENEGYTYMLGVMPRMLVAQARELAVEKALETNCDYLFFIDDDMLCPRNLLKRLLSHNKDIVGSMTFERMGNNNPNIYKLWSYNKNEQGIKDCTTLKWRNILDYKELRDDDGMLEVDVIGFGCVLINMNIFKGDNAIEPPYFMSQFQVGEDFFFCWKAQEKGYQIYADCHDSWLLGHLGDTEIITAKTFELNQLKEQNMPKQKILITGGCGFIGHHVVEHIIKNTDKDIIILDKLTYASTGFNRLRDINVFDDKRVKVYTHDFVKPIDEGLAKEIGQVDYIIHMGAETHVDNSIKEPLKFIETNVMGTAQMLEFAKTQKNLKWFVYFSTDEVFGPAPKDVKYKEWDRYNSTNPYAASKAAGEEIVLAYSNTYKIPAFITHTMNVFGERQNIEKFIPNTIKKILDREKVLIHSDHTKTISGSRYYIHARNVADKLMFLLERAENRQKYNIVGDKEVSNLELAKMIASNLGYPLDYEKVDFHTSRPGHDLRYALDGQKLKDMGYIDKIDFEGSLKKTIEWTLENTKWMEGR